MWHSCFVFLQSKYRNISNIIMEQPDNLSTIDAILHGDNVPTIDLLIPIAVTSVLITLQPDG